MTTQVFTGTLLTSIKDLNESSYYDETVTTSFSDDVDEFGESQDDFSGSLRVDTFPFRQEPILPSHANATPSLDALEEIDLVEGIPRDVYVIYEGDHSVDEGSDIHQRLQIAETLVMSFKAKMKSTEALTDTLYEYLRQAQIYADDVLADRNKLLKEMEMMQEEVQSQLDQRILLKVIMALSLFYFLCGGSHFLLTCSVCLNLLVDVLIAVV